MLLARKVRLSKWEWGERPALSTEEARQSAIEADLRSTDNALSFWRCLSNREPEAREVALAIAAAGDYLQKIQLALVPEESVIQLGLEVAPTPGLTPVADLVESHVTVRFSAESQRRALAHEIRDAVVRGDCHSFPKSVVREMLNEGIRSGRVSLREMSDSLRAKLGLLDAQG